VTGDSVLIEAEGVSKVYRVGEISVSALKSVDLKVVRGEFTAVAGPSGSGKSTLLNILSGLDTPTAGRVSLAGTPISEMSGRVLSDFRRDHIGFIFQAFNLIPVLTVLENIEYILLLQGVSRRARRERVREMLSTVGLEGMEDRRPPQLSGGQQQRVAVARAMVSRPDLILADEPTANLDSATGGALLDLMRELNESRRMTFLFSSHDRMIMDRAKRLVVLRDGSLVQDVTRSGP